MCTRGGEWFFYSPQPYDTGPFKHANIHHRVAGVPSSMRASQLGQLFFPLWARRDKIDVFWSPRHQLPLLLARHIRAVVTIHDLVWLRSGQTMRFPGRQIEGFLMPRSLRMADEVVAVSEFTRSELDYHFPHLPQNIKVVTGASHIANIAGAARFSRPSGMPYFLFVGTMEPRKNLQRLLQAYRLYVDEERRPLQLKIVGGRGWGGVDSGEMVGQLALDSHVEVLGKVSEGKLSALYSNAYAVVMPSLYEGFGLPIVESLSQGVPVITSRNSAMSEVAGAAGVLVDPYSEREICDALLQLTADKALYSNLAGRARRESERYDWEQSACTMYTLLAGD